MRQQIDLSTLTESEKPGIFTQSTIKYQDVADGRSADDPVIGARKIRDIHTCKYIAYHYPFNKVSNEAH